MTEIDNISIEQLKTNALADLAQASTDQELEQWRIQYISRKGSVPQLLRGLKDLPLEQRRALGQLGNEIRQELESSFEAKRSELEATKSGAGQVAGAGHDQTLELKDVSVGHLHPITLTIQRIETILSEMGFMMAEGPLVEEAKFNFDLLNIPLEHPARAETDTFYLKDGHILRTHTSPVQVRTVLEQELKPPFRVFSPGRVFRAERTDASHENTFYQFEGLEVGEKISIADFKGVIEKLYTQFFGQPAKTRLRPGFFPFVEPGFEVDISCVFCQQRGCRVCKQSGWIEIMGAGMVHPNVLRNMNIDPAKYQGYAFGGAIDRVAMLRYGVNDIRLFWSGDLKFLRQFS